MAPFLGGDMITDGKLYALVMAGGSGTRFWPESTKLKPKQYLNFWSQDSLLKETLLRFGELIAPAQRYIVTVQDQEELAKKHSEGLINQDGLIFEPMARNTAPCIFLSLVKLLAAGASKEDVVAIVPADHAIRDHEGFQKTLYKAVTAAQAFQKMVAIAIPPRSPHTGYGYIHRGPEIFGSQCVYEVEEFKEKPDLETAKAYMESGEFFWNAGMFVAPIGILLDEIAKLAPDISLLEFELRLGLGDAVALAKTYAKLPSISIDYAIMEKTTELLVVPSEFDWNDLGSWDALEEVLPKTNGNVFAASSGHTYIDGAEGNIVYAPGKFVTLLGVKDLVIISNKTSLVVMPKKDAQKIKEVVDHLKEFYYGKDLL